MHTMRNRKKLYKTFNTHLILQLSILSIFVLFVSGCGKKAPPVPPHQKKSHAVNDLHANIDGETLKLTWAILGKKARLYLICLVLLFIDQKCLIQTRIVRTARCCLSVLLIFPLKCVLLDI